MYEKSYFTGASLARLQSDYGDLEWGNIISSARTGSSHELLIVTPNI